MGSSQNPGDHGRLGIPVEMSLATRLAVERLLVVGLREPGTGELARTPLFALLVIWLYTR